MARTYSILIWNSYREARHNKVLHIALGFVALIILFSLFMGEVSLSQNEKVVKDMGLASISFLGVFVAVFLGVTTLYRELEQRTIYSIVSKPIARQQILLGKFLGMAFVLLLIVTTMTFYFYVVLWFVGAAIDLGLFPAILLTYLELLVVAALAIFFSSFSSPF